MKEINQNAFIQSVNISSVVSEIIFLILLFFDILYNNCSKLHKQYQISLHGL